MKMDSPVGIYSSKNNPVPAPKKVPVGLGSGSNPDKAKADKLAKKAYAECDSNRGKSGM